MEELTSTTIVPIGLYCFILAVYFLSLALNAIFNNTATNFVYWIGVAVAIILAIGFFLIGLGFLQVKPLYWKILFFTLAISVSLVASFLLACLFFAWLGVNPLSSIIQVNQITPVMWFSTLAVFLSSIIVLYYLSHEQVMKHFGDVGTMISPF